MGQAVPFRVVKSAEQGQKASTFQENWRTSRPSLRHCPRPLCGKHTLARVWIAAQGLCERTETCRCHKARQISAQVSKFPTTASKSLMLVKVDGHNPATQASFEKAWTQTCRHTLGQRLSGASRKAECSKIPKRSITHDVVGTSPCKQHTNKKALVTLL